jgi:tetratricopeptide (TPR) repeat protein
MGTERSRERKPIHFYAAFLILLIPMACTWSQSISGKVVESGKEAARRHLASGRQFLSQGEYDRALKEYEQVLPLTGTDIPKDESIFYSGLIQAYPNNPAKNYGKAMVFFRRLLRDYPNSTWIDQAKLMISLLQENEKLGHTIERLNTIIDELKMVDMGVDEKKRRKVK